MLFFLKYINIIRYVIIISYFILYLNISSSLEANESISIYYGMEVRSDVYIKPHPDFQPPLIEALNSLYDEHPWGKDYPMAHKILIENFHISYPIAIAVLTIQFYHYYYTEPVGCSNLLWPF